MSKLSAPHFHNEEAARRQLEKILWPHGPVCPRCGGLDRITAVKGGRDGLWRCGPCKRQFTVTVGTLFESSHIGLHLWFQAAHLMSASKKGISAHELHRILEVQYKTAWFMAHRIREAMRSGPLAPLGGLSGIIEADETFIGRDKSKPVRSGWAHKHAVLTLVERGGTARSFHIAKTDQKTVAPIVRANIRREASVFTDEAGQYARLGQEFARHAFVRHSTGEYGRGEVHTNTIEGFFSVFKRGMRGVYQHCSEKHLHRYLAEFDFRYNHRIALGVDDEMRAVRALAGITGKRLMYRDSQ